MTETYLDEHNKTLVHNHAKSLMKERVTGFTILDEFLPNLNAYVNPKRSIIIHPSGNVEEQTPVPVARIRHSSRFKESPYTIKFSSTAGKYSNYYFYM